MKTEKDEFVELMRLNMKRAYYSALGILGSHDDAMELSQIAFIRAYKHFASFDRTKNFFTWYYKILKNLCLNKIRDKKRKKEVSLIEYSENESDIAETERNLEQEELRAGVEKALMELEPEDREIIVLKEFEGLTYKEIAELLDIPPGSVMSRLFYARKKLAKKLESELI
ncbi:RNA polymerase sigma factor [Bacteroidota bacterium]